MVWGTFLLLEPYNPSKSARKKSPEIARLSVGGSNCYLGNAQIEPEIISVVRPLREGCKKKHKKLTNVNFGLTYIHTP